MASLAGKHHGSRFSELADGRTDETAIVSLTDCDNRPKARVLMLKLQTALSNTFD